MTDTAQWGWVTHWTDLLDQDEVWRDGTGTVLRLDDMEPDYCGRVRSFCLRNAEQALDRCLYEMAHGPMPDGDVAGDCFNREWDMLEAAGDHPRAWLEESDLLHKRSSTARRVFPRVRRSATAATRWWTATGRGITGPVIRGSSWTDAPGEGGSDKPPDPS